MLLIMAEPKDNWTRMEKLTLGGIIVGAIFVIIAALIGSAIGARVNKVEVTVRDLQDRIDQIEIKNAKIEELDAEVARIQRLLADAIQAGSVQTGPCPEGTCPGIALGEGGTHQGCVPC